LVTFRPVQGDDLNSGGRPTVRNGRAISPPVSIGQRNSRALPGDFQAETISVQR